MPRTSRLTIRQSQPHAYRSNGAKYDTISTIRYESDGEEGGVSHCLPSKHILGTVPHDKATYRVITEVVGSKTKRGSRRIQFHADTSLTAAQAALPLAAYVHGPELDSVREEGYTDPLESMYSYFSDGEGDDGNVFTPVNLGPSADDDVSEPLAVSGHISLHVFTLIYS